ncbi:hypothetical protein SLNWT_6268 [Streptomyces albus]|uniref:Uncharacterized protein n=1 Tax=Streptomyces albus (strain ATCC 21838 / DSM 41398 / FERM P-419 / JCM 4703 / NBRC 107858) TaxID=1081613 RepID=A0A0B5EXS7_STRA4|nr:hypothetical protein SLNWT_6268 [Streptomyces albus]AOU80948.1 hypothetical protein SLNHY_6257 [Streptomyces albus]AYN36651.1 hypothetical protein DUI70_6157 [Streptomyces albus]
MSGREPGGPGPTGGPDGGAPALSLAREPAPFAARESTGPAEESVTAAPGAGEPVQFRAGCPDCRARFELPAGALRLAVGGSSRTTFYSFTCPECGSAVRKPAGERIVELLSGGGVSTLRLQPKT